MHVVISFNSITKNSIFLVWILALLHETHILPYWKSFSPIQTESFLESKVQPQLFDFNNRSLWNSFYEAAVLLSATYCLSVHRLDKQRSLYWNSKKILHSKIWLLDLPWNIFKKIVCFEGGVGEREGWGIGGWAGYSEKATILETTNRRRMHTSLTAIKVTCHWIPTPV